MPIKVYKPVTLGRRLSSVDAFEDITKWEPEKSLIQPRKKRGGRNAQGKITVRHRGGGAAQYVRTVDFRREKYDVPAKVAAIEYDPLRGARIALLNYKDGEKRYMVAPLDLKVGDEIVSSKNQVEIKAGNRMPLSQIPIGIQVHSIELLPGSGGKVARGAGNAAQFMAVEGKYAQLKLPSGEIRMFIKDCMATVGTVGNPDHRLVRWGKAGRTRHRGRRPQVRGKVMNPVDHPHGGGEGKHPIGLKYPKTKWGKHALGVKTRDRKKGSSKFIVKRRK
jgi:large subunit ribosomal protein L2